MAINIGDPIKADDINKRVRGVSGLLAVGESVTIFVPESCGFLFYGGGQATDEFSIIYISAPFVQQIAGKSYFIPDISFSNDERYITIKNTQNWGQSYNFIAGGMM